MKNSKRILKIEITVLAALVVAGGLTSCSSEPTRVDKEPVVSDLNRDARTTTNALNATDRPSFVTEVTFDRGSAVLKAESKDKLDRLVARAQETGSVDDIKVITWADQAYPANAKRDLPKAQQNLADKRSDKIKEYLTHDRSFDIDTFNMAKKPSAVSELFNTDNAKVKESLAKAGMSETGASESKAGKAMVLVILK